MSEENKFGSARRWYPWLVIGLILAVALAIDHIPALGRGVERILLAAFGLLMTALAAVSAYIAITAIANVRATDGSRAERIVTGVLGMLLGGWISYISFFR